MADSLHDRLVYYTKAEEVANRLTHGLGVLLALAATLVMIVVALRSGDPWRIVSVSIHGGSFILFYVVSTVYHTMRHPRAKYVFRILDHAGIYLVIAATYTPFTLVSLRGPWGWSLFVTVWGLAVAGAVFKSFMTHRLQILAPIFYIVMGWLAVIAYRPLLAALSPAGMAWLVAGGVVYTLGVVFYAWDRIPYNHAIWHMFVLVGSACHFFAVLWYVLPM